ncbi:MAG: hemin uptake protein HemP [Planctomycetota bacterium]
MDTNDDDSGSDHGNHRAFDDALDESSARPRIIESEQILSGRREVWIRHGDEMYRLRITAAGKLYLSK